MSGNTRSIYSVCIRCLDGRVHPFHDNGDVNEAWEFDEKSKAPQHIEQMEDEE